MFLSDFCGFFLVNFCTKKHHLNPLWYLDDASKNMLSFEYPILPVRCILKVNVHSIYFCMFFFHAYLCEKFHLLKFLFMFLGTCCCLNT